MYGYVISVLCVCLCVVLWPDGPPHRHRGPGAGGWVSDRPVEVSSRGGALSARVPLSSIRAGRCGRRVVGDGARMALQPIDGSARSLLLLLC